MDYSTILEGLKNDFILAIDELFHHIKLLREDVEELKKQQAKDHRKYD